MLGASEVVVMALRRLLVQPVGWRPDASAAVRGRGHSAANGQSWCEMGATAG